MNFLTNIFHLNKENKKERISWYFYDFANSAFATTVISVFLGPYFTYIANQSVNINGKISFLWFQISAGAFYPIVVAISVFLQLFIIPFFSSLADHTRFKKHILFVATYIGAISTLSLFFVDKTNLYFGALLFIIANVCFGLSCAVYNSYLNHITVRTEADTVSFIGWGLGYFGGGMLLLFNLLFYSNAKLFGIEKDFAIRICLSSAGIWWGIFSLIPLKYLRQTYHQKIINNKKHILKNGFNSLNNTIKDLKNYPQVKFFIIAYMLYNDGIQSVIILAGQFGNIELGLDMNVLIICILIVQFVAFLGVFIFNKISEKVGALNTLRTTIIFWIWILIFAFGYLYTERDFYFLCICVGLVLGTSQALSRSIFSQIIPSGKETEYFSIYELSDKGTSWLGPIIYAVVFNWTLSYRYAILSLIIFFVIGFIMLMKFNFEKSVVLIKE